MRAPIAAALLVASLVLAPTAAAQQTTEQKEVLAVLAKFFDGMTRRDTALSRAVMLPGSVFYATLNGRTEASSDTAYINSLTRGSQKLVERIHNPSVYVHGPVAEVWTLYEFIIDGKRSHCGVDSFTFVQTPTGWRMATAVYSIQRDGCPTVPTGSP